MKETEKWVVSEASLATNVTVYSAKVSLQNYFAE